MDQGIDLRQLRCFLAVAESSSFTRAAERLHLSQPPLTRQIRQLEERLGVTLFERGRRGAELTGAGRAFLPEVRRTLAQFERALGAARAHAGSARQRFVIGYTTVVDAGAIPDVAPALRQRFPELDVVLRGAHSIALVRGLRRGELDAAFIGLHTEAQGLCVQTLHQQPFVVALPSGHRLAARRQLDFGDLEGERVFWFERRLNPGFHDHCTAFFERIGLRFQPIAEPADHHILLGQIAAGQGIGLIPQSLRSVQRQGVVFRPLKPRQDALAVGIALAHAPDRASPVMRALLELARADGAVPERARR